MVFDFSQLAPDAAHADGVWTRCLLTQRDGTQIDTGCDLKLRYLVDNEAIRRRQATLTAAAQRRSKNQPLNDAEQADIVRRSVAGTVLMGWKGYMLGGVEVPFSEAAAEKALLANVQFSDFVANYASNLDNFRTPPPALAEGQAPANPDDGEEQDPTVSGVLKKVS